MSEEAEVLINFLFTSTRGTEALVPAPEAGCLTTPSVALGQPHLLIEINPVRPSMCTP
ncbi:hypothetical protein L873DRAFT_1814937 [Choiromyces venosus 120613-1]|uniref:Uncharacterized protein n=1 Tax=Choiromyces venosus 120613-1 TaxID=1336337 RepID=A0A3N4J758_9PEZI|nr:hypothetical protein L873DRAFT_1814937 [Choiromyces venosus 120613-1]